MPGWGLFILVVVVLGVAYFVSRQFGDTRPVLITWIIAGLIIAAGLVMWGNAKVGEVKEGFQNYYQLDESR